MRWNFIPLATELPDNPLLPRSLYNDRVFIFDIDYTLFRSREMMAHELSIIKKTFLGIEGMTEQKFKDMRSKYTEFKQALYDTVNIHPAQCCTELDNPDIELFVNPDDKKLQEAIGRLNGRKICFTNGTEKRVKKILEYLGLNRVFDAVLGFDVNSLDFVTKPKPESFDFVERYLGLSSTNNVYFFDDTKENVEAARERGWKAYLVSDEPGQTLIDLLENIEQ